MASDSPRSSNITRVEHRVGATERVVRNGHAGGIMWMTGLSGAGKSTLARELERTLFADGYQTYFLDGDNLRHGLSADLGFSIEDRNENIRRVGETAALFADAGMLVITAFISPLRAQRDAIRRKYAHLYHEVFIHAPLEECERRDNKGLYRKARAGKLPDFTGVSSPYEPPLQAELTIATHEADVAACVGMLRTYVERHFRRGA